MIVPINDMIKPNEGRGYSLFRMIDIVDSKIDSKGKNAQLNLSIHDLPAIGISVIAFSQLYNKVSTTP